MNPWVTDQFTVQNMMGIQPMMQSNGLNSSSLRDFDNKGVHNSQLQRIFQNSSNNMDDKRDNIQHSKWDDYDRNSDRSRRERKRTKWDSNDGVSEGMDRMNYQGNMMYNNMVGQQIDMLNMQNMGNVGNIQSMGYMSSNSSIVPAMMEQNSLMMMQSMPMMNRDDLREYEKRPRAISPPHIEPFSPATLTAILEKIKSDTDFCDAAPTLLGWLERGECNKRNANTIYSLIQSTNHHARRLYNEKMLIDEEFNALKNNVKEKYSMIIAQFEQVAKILTAAKHQRGSDHFTKQQRRNVEMWLKLTEDLESIREEFKANFNDEEVEMTGKNMVSMEKYEQLQNKNKKLTFELEGYRNEAYLAQNEAERKFEIFKAHFIAKQALEKSQSESSTSLSTPNVMSVPSPTSTQTPAENVEKPLNEAPKTVSCMEAKLISLLSAFLIIHPLGANTDYLVSYIRSMMPDVPQATVEEILQKFTDVFQRKTYGVGANMENRWHFVTFETVKNV